MCSALAPSRRSRSGGGGDLDLDYRGHRNHQTRTRHTSFSGFPGGLPPRIPPPGPQAPRGPGMDTTTGVAVSIPGTRNSSGGLSVGAFRGPETWPTRGTRSAKGKQRYRTSSLGRSASAELFGSASGTASVPDASDPPARPRPPRPPSPSAPLIIWAPIFFAVCDGGGYWGDPPP